MSRNKSILLQVAFKEAVSATIGTTKSVRDATLENYQTLIGLHEELGISLEDTKGGGGNWGNKTASAAPKVTPAGVGTFTDAAGIRWQDWRQAKADGTANAKHPDFKTVDQSKAVARSEWLFDPQGQANPIAIELAAAADNMATLTASA